MPTIQLPSLALAFALSWVGLALVWPQIQGSATGSRTEGSRTRDGWWPEAFVGWAPTALTVVQLGSWAWLGTDKPL